VHDVCLQNLPVIFAIDRAGLVGEDGPTHHGVFDIPFLLHVPNLIIISPKDGRELKASLSWALEANSPVAIRYPRGKVPAQDGKIFSDFANRSAEVMLSLPKGNTNKTDILLIGVGPVCWSLEKVAKDLHEKNHKSVTLLNLRFLKPLDLETLNQYISHAKDIFIVEESSSIGGIYAYILQSLNLNKDLKQFHQIALPDKFIEAGTIEILQDKYNLSIGSLYKEITSKLPAH
jgi:1-deoxy-D-xylulose-5-phosphate synthase